MAKILLAELLNAFHNMWRSIILLTFEDTSGKHSRQGELLIHYLIPWRVAHPTHPFTNIHILTNIYHLCRSAGAEFDMDDVSRDF